MSAKDIDVGARIRAKGWPAPGPGRMRGGAAVRMVYCWGCGAGIRSDSFEGVGYVKSKRGTEMFFCPVCRERIEGGRAAWTRGNG